MTNATPIAFLVDSSGVPLRQGVVVDAASGAPTIVTINPATGLPVLTVVGSGGGGSFSTLTGQPTDNANLSAALAARVSFPPWTGTTPALASGTNPITAGFGSNAFVYTGAGTSPTLDGVSGVSGDIFIFGVGGVNTWTKWVSGGGYLGVFGSAAALQTAYPAATNPCCIALVAGYPFISNGTAWVSHGVGVTGGIAPNGDTVQITANVTISVANANVATYNGKVLEFTGAFTVTLAAGLPNDFGFAGIPPSSGNASIASDATTTLNGATTTVTRAAASYAMFAVVQRSTNRNAYVVN